MLCLCIPPPSITSPETKPCMIAARASSGEEGIKRTSALKCGVRNYTCTLVLLPLFPGVFQDVYRYAVHSQRTTIKPGAHRYQSVLFIATD